MFATSLHRTAYQKAVKPMLFKRDPEWAHYTIARMGKVLGTNLFTRSLTRALFNYEDPILSSNVAGIDFRNPVGLSAGFDKDAELQNIMPDVGFGMEEIGSVTLHPYEGNPRPWLYRLPKSKALVVYFGLKNVGVDEIIRRLKGFKREGFVLNISVAKTNSSDTSTPKGGAQDYADCLRKLIDAGVGDMYTINISCPNTFGGEPFTTPALLEQLCDRLNELQISKPVFIKMPIDQSWEDFRQLLEVLIRYKYVSGVTIGNLTKDRNSNAIRDTIPDSVKGGISGKPTWEKSNGLITHTYAEYGNRLKIIGVGGIFSAEDAYEKIRRGASLVELITGMVYQGPQLIGEINHGLAEMLRRDGYRSLAEAVGTYTGKQ